MTPLEREAIRREIEAELARLDPLVPESVKRATEELIDQYWDDLRRLAKV